MLSEEATQLAGWQELPSRLLLQRSRTGGASLHRHHRRHYLLETELPSVDKFAGVGVAVLVVARDNLVRHHQTDLEKDTWIQCDQQHGGHDGQGDEVARDA